MFMSDDLEWYKSWVEVRIQYAKPVSNLKRVAIKVKVRGTMKVYEVYIDYDEVGREQ